MTGVHVVLPGDVDDPARTSGGNVYDRRVCDELATDLDVHELPVPGTWPHPDDAARAELARALAAVPDGGPVLLDGLVACAVPDVVAAQADRLRLTVLVHLPLGDEAGLDPETAAELTGRERATLHSAAAVVATSPWAARRIADVHGVSAHVATPGVDPGPVTPAGDGSRLISVGSVTPTKGHDLLVEALALVVGLDWTCRIVGPLVRDPDHVAVLRATIARRHLDDRVQLTGPEADVTWTGADLLVLPSRTETYAMVVTEALAHGIPVLAADVGGVADTLGRAADGSVPGLLVPPGNAAALAAALRRWLDDADLRETARRSALARRAELDGWEVTARCLAKVLL
ncbi:glycosyltransferase family 4 protein [Pseudonocardia sp. 73-21]|uniref:glycosyltransferase family 4 protein n=1 Tax=Pseudonocardia sp. 73-21 TaxID=1895809 RepID=UPI000A658093|nr:glycosyltransferase family 4 protein [Pseudonocardia sp. 73-21]